jgi:hypothetical protein
MPMCGYEQPLVADNCVFTDDGQERRVSWAAFSQKPHDARSACLAAIDVAAPTESIAAQYRYLGAPALFACAGSDLYWFRHDTFGSQLLERIPAKNVANFFDQHKAGFAPQRIYRAKTTAKFDFTYQLDFVDAGLIPLLEKDSGQWLGERVESLVSTVQTAMAESDRVPADPRHVFQSVFWLLAARLLKDKGVRDFKAIDMMDLDLVFERVAKHYDAKSPPTRTRAARDGMLAAAERVKAFPSLANVTTETLAYLHENTLVSPEIRKAFGTHSTPQWLVDYIVWQLTPWIKNIAPEDRHALEPGCGHAPFLVAALRVLQQDTPERLDDKQRAKWLRQRVRGMEEDDFAREIGRLSLTIADVPNPNGWTLTAGDMFKGPELAHGIKHATILLSNPPFEDFKGDERERYNKSRKLTDIRFNKASELLSQIVEYLPADGVFGLVMPKNILTSRNSRSIRERLTREFELHDICMLPDRVFGKAHDESVVLLGRRKVPSAFQSVCVRRVRPWDLNAFRTRLETSSEVKVPQAAFLQHKDISFRVPDLQEVWESLRDNARLGKWVKVQKGFEFKNKASLAGRTYISAKPKKGFVKAYLDPRTEYDIFDTPVPEYIEYSRETLRARGGGAKPGAPQVIVNYAGSERPWCRKATVDDEGVAVESRFLVFRPNDTKSLPLNVLWAILNSPVANAYTHSYSTKWQTLPKEWRAFPLPMLDVESIAEIADAANAYRQTAKAHSDEFFSQTSEIDVCQKLMQMDATVLKAYALPPGLEQKMLSIFDDVDRPGVGCKFTSYPQVPTTVHLPFHLRLLLPRFHQLVDLRLAGKVNRQQLAELKEIEDRFDSYEQEFPTDAAFQAWMKELDQRHAQAASKLDAIEAKFRKRAGGGGA